jgi:hypothetical protein
LENLWKKFLRFRRHGRRQRGVDEDDTTTSFVPAGDIVTTA